MHWHALLKTRFAWLVLACALATKLFAGEAAGKWAGSWQDSGSGHSGPLKARIRQNCDGSYRAVFHGRFFKVIPFRYKTDLDVIAESDGCTQMRGRSRIPLFGDFHYDAIADTCNFNLNFCAKRYSGSFTMERR